MAIRSRLDVLALCAGAGGLELGVRLAVPRARLVGAVEREAFAAAALVARMGDKTLEPAPIWDDVTTFDGRPWRGAVDLITAGFPCQPWSQAGSGLGVADARWLWPAIAEIIEDVAPPLVFLENVPRLATGGGLALVLDGLAARGFDAEWATISAAALGAPHLRRRLFVLAYRHSGGRPELGAVGPRDETRDDADQGHPAMADPGRVGGERPGIPGDIDHRGAFPVWPPGPDASEAWTEVARQNGPLPAVRRVADGLADRLDRLHAIGNGVVPVVAAYAFLALADRAGLEL